MPLSSLLIVHVFTQLRISDCRCAHCKAFEPTWEEFALKVKGQAKVAKVDATANRGMAQHFSVKAFPTLKAVRGDDVFSYSGPFLHGSAC